MATVGLPLTGAGDATATVATDQIGGAHWQRVKLFDGTEGSTLPIIAKETTPGSTDSGLVVRSIGSTAFNQAVVGSVGITSGSSVVSLSSQHTVSADLTSVGSTRLVGRVDVNNPTTAVSLSSQHTITVGNPTTAVSAELTSGGSTRLAGRFDVNNQPTVDLSSVGSTKVVGTVNVTSGTILGAGSTANTLGSVAIVAGTSANIIGSVTNAAGTSGTLIGAVAVSSGVVLGAGSTANSLGAVALVAGTSANIVGTVALTGGTTANTLGSVALVAGSSVNVLGSVTISPGASTVGSVQQGAGSSANFWYTQPLAFSSANMARTTVNTTVDISIIAANANRKALVIANLSTVQTVAIGMSTGAVTTGLTNANLFLPPNSQLTFGYSGGMPLFTGPYRGINITSTTVAGGVAVMEFT